MKRSLLLVALAIAFTSCTTSKRLSHLSMPETKIDSVEIVNLAEYERKYGKYDGVYLNVETVIEHSGGKGAFQKHNWSFHRINKRKYLVLNPDAQWLTRFRVYYKPKKLYMRVISPHGAVRDYGLEDLQEEKDDDGDKVYTFVYPDIVKGSVIEEGYDLSYGVSGYPPPLKHNIGLQFSIPCEKLTFSYACPDWWVLNMKQTAEDKSPNYTIRHDEKNHKRFLTFEGLDIPPVVSESYSPFFKEMADYLQFMVTELKMLESYKFSTPKSWDEYAKDVRKGALKKSRKGAHEVQTTVNRIVQGANTPIDKLDAIVTYARDSIELINKSKEGNYGKVLKEKVGNAFDVTGLTKAMLEYVDLPAEFLLVHSSRDGYFDRDYISHDQFNIPAVGVTVEREEYVVFPYIEYLPIDHIPSHLLGQPALVIDEESSGMLVRVPSGNRATNAVEETYELNIGADGTILVQEKKILRGSLAYVLRKYLTSLTQDELKDEMEELLTYTDGDVYMKSHEIVNLDEYKKPLILELDYSIENLITITPEEAVFQTGGLFSPISGKKIKLDPRERQNPVKISFNEQYKKNIVIQFPSEWRTITELTDLEFDNQFGSIQGRYEIENDRIEVSQELVLHKSFEPKETITDFLALIGRGSKLRIPTIVFAVGELDKPE